MKIKKEKKKAVINIKFDKNPKDGFDGWYERFENNGWRPVICNYTLHSVVID
jgi:hypothetical protein